MKFSDLLRAAPAADLAQAARALPDDELATLLRELPGWRLIQIVARSESTAPAELEAPPTEEAPPKRLGGTSRHRGERTAALPSAIPSRKEPGYVRGELTTRLLELVTAAPISSQDAAEALGVSRRAVGASARKLVRLGQLLCDADRTLSTPEAAPRAARTRRAKPPPPPAADEEEPGHEPAPEEPALVVGPPEYLAEYLAPEFVPGLEVALEHPAAAGEVDLAGLARNMRRSRRKRLVRAHTVNVSRLTKRDLEEGRASYPEDIEGDKPRTRSACIDGPRPCPHVSCKHHLYLDVTENGSIKMNFPDLEPEHLRESCCNPGLKCDVCELADMAGACAEHACYVEFGLHDAKRALREIAGRYEGAGMASMAKMARNALAAVEEAELTLKAADAFVEAPQAKKRKLAESLAAICAPRVIPKPIRWTR